MNSKYISYYFFPVFVFIFAAIAVVIIFPGQKETVLDGIFSREQANRGNLIYSIYCLECHGDKLQGGGTFIPTLSGIDFTANWKRQSLDNLFSYLVEFMPLDSPRSLTPQEYVDVLSYILEYNGYPHGKEELPPVRTELKRLRFVPIH